MNEAMSEMVYQFDESIVHPIEERHKQYTNWFVHEHIYDGIYGVRETPGHDHAQVDTWWEGSVGEGGV